MTYLVLSDKNISSSYRDDEPETFTEAIKFETEVKLKEWIAKNSNLRKFTVVKVEEVKININVEIS
jgi:hypothetical protein